MDIISSLFNVLYSLLTILQYDNASNTTFTPFQYANLSLVEEFNNSIGNSTVVYKMFVFDYEFKNNEYEEYELSKIVLEYFKMNGYKILGYEEFGDKIIINGYKNGTFNVITVLKNTKI